MQDNVLLINIPPKVWRPKMVNIYTPTDQSNGIREGVFEFKQYGNTMFRPKIKWVDHNREDVIQYNEGIHKAELEKYIRIGQNVSKAHK